MAYYSGTVTSADSFLNDIKTSALLNGWSADKDLVTGSPVTRELIMTSTDGVTVGFKLYPSGTSKTVNVMMNVSESFDNGQSFHNQPGGYAATNVGDEDDNCCFFTREGHAIKYHLAITSRKIACVYQTAGAWMPFYVGKFLAYNSPAGHTNPYFIGGNVEFDFNLPDDEAWVTAYSKEFFPVSDETFNQPAAKLSDNSWIQFRGDTGATSNVIIPTWQTNAMDSILPNLDGSYTMQPLILCQRVDGSTRGKFLGELDNLFVTSSKGLYGGRIVHDGVDDYICCPTVMNQDPSFGYILMKLV